ncbi:MAG: hypothetical protein OQL06_08065 [Gammaproteobacteria bacterium]|nr:hypothetical protein [Gammaproteobacteria bacterium]
MPWWAIAYLVVLTAVIFISIIKDYLDKRSIAYILGEVFSGAIGIVFITAHWKPELAGLLSWMVLPFLVYAIAWDQYALRYIKASNYPDLSEQENRDMDRYSKIFAILFILPCYIAGAILSYKLLS